MIEVINAAAGYGKGEVLRGVDLAVPQGRITTVIGGNGSGKSTLLRAILGFLPLSGGEIRVDGTSVTKLPGRELARKIAYLPQGKSIPDISAERMVLHGRFPYLEYPRRYKERDFRIARESMERMGIGELAERQMAELSGGMRQKVYLAMALAQQAPVILMDEPTTYLDIGEQFRFEKMIRQLSGEGKTILLVLHDILLALKLSDRIGALHKGRILREGTPEEILDSHVLEEMYGVSVKAVSVGTEIQYYYSGSKD